MRRATGQATVENVLVMSVLTIAIVGASYAFMPAFSRGVDALSRDVSGILASGSIGDGGGGGGNMVPGGQRPGAPGSDTNDNGFGRSAGSDTSEMPRDVESGNPRADMADMVSEFNTYAPSSDTGETGNTNQPPPVPL